MSMHYDAGLILEGGGMRGLYTAGVLDYFLDHDIQLAHCYGVSAGAVNATNYVAKQRGRSKRTTINYIRDKRYCSMKNLLTTRNIFGTDFLYNRIPNELDPFDYESFKRSGSSMSAVVSNVRTGKSYYREIRDLRKDMNWLRASCSLPFLSETVEIEGEQYLDGGLSDSIPLAKAMEDGYQKNIVVLTRQEGYQKKKETISGMLGSLVYRKYPNLLNESKMRHMKYNQQLAFVEEQERLGNVFVFRPSNLFQINRLEKDPSKLSALYEQGYKDARRQAKELLCFLNTVKQAEVKENFI